MSDLKKTIISLFITAIIVSSAIIAYQYREDIHIGKLMFGKEDKLKRSGIYVRFILSASVDDKTLRLRFLVPCQDLKQRDEMLRKLSMIKNEMLMTLSRPEVVRVVEQRSFSTIKKCMLQAINNHSSESVNTLYLENFFCN